MSETTYSVTSSVFTQTQNKHMTVKYIGSYHISITKSKLMTAQTVCLLLYISKNPLNFNGYNLLLFCLNIEIENLK